MKGSPAAYVLAASLGLVAASVAYVAEGVFSRFDRAVAVIEKVPATLVSVDDSTRKIMTVMVDLEAKMAMARAGTYSDGEEFGGSGLEMVDAMKRRLELMEAERALDDPALGLGGNDTVPRKPGEFADILNRRLACWRAKRELGKSGGVIGMWCGYEDLVANEPETEEELRHALENPDQAPLKLRGNDPARDALERLGIREMNSGNGGSVLSDVRELLQMHKDEASGEGQIALSDGGSK